MCASEEDGVKNGKSQGKKADRWRVIAFIVYADSAYSDWIARLDARHVRGFVSPLHDRDVDAEGNPKKPHWHVILFFDGKKSQAQLDELRTDALGENFNKAFENVQSAGAYSRYLTHMDNPEKAQYDRRDVLSLGGADYDLATSMPGDDAVILCEISAYVVERGITFLPALIKACQTQGRRDWISYISRRGYLVNALITQNNARLQRIAGNSPLEGDVVF